MKIALTSVLVDDQVKALKFYTEVLGFVKKTDVPAGEFRWLTVISPEVSNLQKEYERLKALGVVFRTPPAKAGPVSIAVFDDTCGNLIQLVQP